MISYDSMINSAVLYVHIYRNEYLQKAQQYQMAQQMIVSTEGESQIPVRPPASLPLQEGRGLEGVVPLDGVPQGSLTPLELGAASYHGGSSLAPHHQSGPGLLRFLSDPRLKDERKLGLGQSGGPGAQAHTPQGFLGSFSGRFSSGGLSSSDSVQSGNQDTPPPPPLASPSGIVSNHSYVILRGQTLSKNKGPAM